MMSKRCGIEMVICRRFFVRFADRRAFETKGSYMFLRTKLLVVSVDY